MDTTADLDASATGLVTEVTHPLVQHKLGLLRDTTTTTQMFRQLVNELTLLLTYEATKDLADDEIEIETPLERTAARRISGKKVAVCPILRAGMGMLDAVLSLVPGARVGFIGLFRDEETLEPSSTSSSSPATSSTATSSFSIRCWLRETRLPRRSRP